MGPIEYLKQRRLQRKRKQDAIRLLMKSSVIRSASHRIRYSMTPKELRRMMADEETPCQGPG